ncbi:MAG: RluA family pseudouridine synthase [Oscillospiraceae bacterium]|nr:RluA family pseudouridine synthase [Oscillospiraceae bacterium]MBR1458369.1 RluA family pseudouridine synthase [Oscillospiraceae bacterium]
MPDLIYTMHRPEPCRAEVFLRQDCGLSHRQLTHLKHVPGGITRGGMLLRTVDTVYPGDVIRLHLPDAQHTEANLALHVPEVFLDADVLFYDKPAGTPVHPSQRHHGDTLANVFAAVHPGLTFRPVYRLDMDTSGLVGCAMHAVAASQLPGRIEKRYYAVVEGDLPDAGTICAPIGRDPGSIIRRRIDPAGKHAVTHYRVLRRGRFTLAECRLETGRTHQIRVHMAHIGCPLAGDSFYGGAPVLPHHALHCGLVYYTDAAGICHEIRSPLPRELEALVQPE